MTSKDTILLKNDLAFKMVFGRDDERCKYILKSLLKTILHIEIDKIEYKNPINLNDSIDSKEIEFDISVTIEGSVNCDIEIQLREQKSFNKRMVYYGASLLRDGLDISEDYGRIRKAIVIGLCDFIMFNDEEKYQNNFIMKERTSNIELSDILEIITLEMPKADIDKPINEMTDTEKWLAYIKYNGDPKYKEKIEAISRESEEIEMAENMFNEIKNNEHARSALSSRQKYLLDMNTYIAESRAEGEYEKAVKIAIKMLKKNIPIEEIADFTELTETQINKIKINL